MPITSVQIAAANAREARQENRKLREQIEELEERVKALEELCQHGKEEDDAT